MYDIPVTFVKGEDVVTVTSDPSTFPEYQKM